ncbi:hypothetical protein WM41_2553 [Corynebacterium simulans]|uniref:Uncharacterized protein n=1 Tax=Corynebacterium simulans TaxID=146827 RepID=A0ABR5V5S0_9CORY|nr:hypothetical protein WM41_2553 [Corynebacterium simulans]
MVFYLWSSCPFTEGLSPRHFLDNVAYITYNSDVHLNFLFIG